MNEIPHQFLPRLTHDEKIELISTRKASLAEELVGKSVVMSKSCPRPVQVLSKSCPSHVQVMPKTCPAFAHGGLHEVQKSLGTKSS